MDRIKKGSDLASASLIDFNSRNKNISTNQRYKNYVPLDYIKAELIDFDTQQLLSNEFLNFSRPINEDSGEIKNAKNRKPYRLAKFRNLIFKYYTDSSKVYLSGSIHVLYNDGKHNYNDFNIQMLDDVLRELFDLFGILPRHLKITQLEWGVNIRIPYKVSTIIDHCLSHKWKRFVCVKDDKEGKYHQAEHKHNYILKIYNKGLHYGLGYDLLRFERKQMSWLKFAKKERIGQTLDCLIKSDFKGLKRSLLSNWNEVLFYDPMIDTSNLKQLQYRDPLFWSDYSSSRQARHKHYKLLKHINKTIGGNVQDIIYNIIENKIMELNNEILTFSDFSYNKNTSTRIIHLHWGIEQYLAKSC
ncbi:hypothetical protein DNU06_02580 [Putridiphycobacter roseus]|uniref:Replication-associated protein G2P N-terminal domain-containing protein n=1 Tax=Putridiphycobacter roseus TaxID=2219161 RepID=A0A2W1NI81_9FLAO|nr:hypothetical protein [Putridiphycobacter roseus]PZE18733.1 hypothetical protein DNU06_02580 [Putridiphycobacter roseus]